MDANDLISEIVDSAITVKKTLGHGFLEAVYHNALMFELQHRGFKCEKEKDLKVYYLDRIAGAYRADLIVEGKVIVEVKMADDIALGHEYQLVNYLRATNIEDGIIVNFGTFPIGFKRKFLNKNNQNDDRQIKK